MTLVTRCPACGTHFKVVRDQMRISQGWVRCGRCSEVFDASQALREVDDSVLAPQASVPESSFQGIAADGQGPGPSAAVQRRFPQTGALPGDEAGAGASEFLSAPASISSGRDWQARQSLDFRATPPQAIATVKADPPSMLLVHGIVADEPWPAAASAPKVVPTSTPHGRQADFSSRTPQPSLIAASPMDAVDPASLQKALRRQRANELKRARVLQKTQEKAEAADSVAHSDRWFGDDQPDASFETPDEEAPPLPSFLQPRQGWRHRRENGGRPPRSVGWSAVAVLAGLLLVLQVLRHERDELAARQPTLRPMLSQLCALSGCKLAAPRQIGSITIDGAAFERERAGDGFRLSFSLRNGVAMPLAMPAIELTLLDTQERAVVRRVILPEEFGAPPVLDADAERMVSLTLALDAAGAATLPPVVGYRVIAFYP